MASKGTINCALCGNGIPVTLVRVSGQDEPVQLRLLDSTSMVDHMRTCAGSGHKEVTQRPKALWPTNPHLIGRIGLMLERQDYVSIGGSRACTMCGTKGHDCLDALRKPGKQAACCAACGEGNTHPAPGESVGSCAQWAAEKVGPIR